MLQINIKNKKIKYRNWSQKCSYWCVNEVCVAFSSAAGYAILRCYSFTIQFVVILYTFFLTMQYFYIQTFQQFFKFFI